MIFATSKKNFIKNLVFPVDFANFAPAKLRLIGIVGLLAQLVRATDS